MYQKKHLLQIRPILSLTLALTLVLPLLLTACGGKDTAADMRLVKTDGTVRVDNAEGKSIKVREDLGLYSGYELTTQRESYGWISMDDTKLAKMDEDSDVEIRKKKKELELYLRSGSLFFNVTEPLAEDETMDIRTSTMAVGIRGTCGWVEAAGADLMCVYLLRGKVECTVYDRDGNALTTETITAGQAAKMVRDGDSASITVAAFNTSNTPDFVTDALNHPEDWPTYRDYAADDRDSASGDDMNMFGGADGDTKNLDDQTADESSGSAENQGTAADQGTDTDLWTAVTPDALEQYRTIVSEADTYEYENWVPLNKYKYALYQDEEGSIPTLILESLDNDRTGYLLFRYNVATGTTEQIGSDSSTRFEPASDAINSIPWDSWYDITDSSGLDAWEP